MLDVTLLNELAVSSLTRDNIQVSALFSHISGVSKRMSFAIPRLTAWCSALTKDVYKRQGWSERGYCHVHGAGLLPDR